MRNQTTLSPIVITVSLLVLMTAGCPAVPGDGSNTNDNSGGNTNGNVDDNANDNVDDNTNDNGDDNSNDNVNDNTAFSVFQDPDTDFSTTDVYDVDLEVVRFDPTTQAVIWAADGFGYDFGDWPVEGNLLGRGGPFQVLFGTQDGQRRAYFTETSTSTICDLSVIAGSFGIFPTNVTVPQQ